MGHTRILDFFFNLRASFFNDDLSHESKFGWIHLAEPGDNKEVISV
jgi:hypothetical protein